MATKPIALPNVGEMLNAHLTAQNVPKAALCRNMDRHPKYLQADVKKTSLKTELLWHYSLALGHNFFADLAAQLPDYFTTNVPDPTLPFKQRIDQLEEEVKLLNVKVEILEGVLK
ncbi:hypothetical protein [Aequorivita echinoideorum]|uniref:Uncharacterized protein n=1 Tax=Aequorivita echinoideorum TaxID=1549647 RepID=A0ABS5S3W4_9FLAO|nr:hypothetical protein [Aequorivita echinoideorum]MBT0607895.1 hypothetical protein [Aequorivita echinoideorum]